MKQAFSRITGSSRNLVVVAFVLVFGGIGTYALLSGHAATPCNYTDSSVSQASQDVASAPGGSIVCITSSATGNLSLSGTHSSTVTVEPAPLDNNGNALDPNGAGKVTLGGINVSGTNITVQNFYSTGGMNFGTGSSNDEAYHNDVTNSAGGFGISVLCTTTCSNITIKGNRIHNLQNSGANDDGDVIRLDGWTAVTVDGNELVNNYDLSSSTAHMDCLQSYTPTSTPDKFVFENNYVHDNNCEGPPFYQEEGGTGTNMTITDNLVLRMSNSCSGCASYPGATLFINTAANPITITKNVYLGTNGSAIQNQGSDTINVNHNIFDALNTPPSAAPGINSDFNIFTGNNEWAWKLGPNDQLTSLSSIPFKCGSTCGSLTAPSSSPSYLNKYNDDYELASNPNGIGIDWNPANETYGPMGGSGSSGGGTTTPPANTAPTASVTAPANNASASGTVNVTASASATTSGASIASVQFQIDGANVGSADTAAPYSYSWNTTGLTNGSKHTIDAIAKDSNGLSTTSTLVTVTVNNSSSTPPSDTTPPTVSLTAPSSGATIKGTTTVTATASDNVGVSSVQLQVDGANVGTADTSSPYSFSLDTTKLSNGSHKLTAIAKDAAGNSTTSGSVTVTVNNAPPVPATPTALHSTATTQTSISLAWTDTDTNVSGYLVYRGGTLVKTITTATASYTDPGLTAGTAYSYTVEAYDSGNTANPSLPTSPLVASTATAQQSIAAPTKLTGSASSATTVNLSWTASTSSNVSHYYVVRSSANSPAATIATLGNVTSFTDNPVTASTAYTYYVMAGDSSGNFSAPSNSITATTPKAPDTTPPTVPAGLTATAVSPTQINLAWTASTDNSGQVAGYYIFRSDKGSAIYATVTNGTTWGESNLTPSTAYTYTVKAYDASGNISAASAPATANTPAQPTTGSGSGPTSVGTTTVGSLIDGNNSGMAEAFQTTAATNGSIANVHVYIDRSSKATKVTVGLYQDNGGRPGQLMAQGTTTSLHNGTWNVIPIPQASIDSSHIYWIAILGVGRGNVAFRDSNNGKISTVSTQTNLTTLPTQWSSGSLYKNSPISAYATN